MTCFDVLLVCDEDRDLGCEMWDVDVHERAVMQVWTRGKQLVRLPKTRFV